MIIKVLKLINIKLFELIIIFIALLFVAILEFLSLGMFLPLLNLNDENIANNLNIYKIVTENNPSTAIIIFGIIYSIKTILIIIIQVAQKKYIQKKQFYLRKNLLRKILNKNYSDFHSKKLSHYIHIIHDLTGHLETVMSAYIKIAINITIGFGIIMLLAITNLWLTVVTFSYLLLICIFIAFFLIRRLKVIGKKANDLNSKALNHLMSIINSYDELLFYKKSDFYINKYDKLSIPIISARTKKYAYDLIPRNIIENSVIWGGILLVGLTQLLNKNIDFTSYALIFALAIMRLLPIGIDILNQINNERYSSNSVNELIEIFNADIKNSQEISLSDKRVSRTVNSITINSLNFINSKNKEILIKYGSQFYVNRGDFIAITGPSGSGKSTFIKILCGLVKDTDGSFYVNNSLYTKTLVEEYSISYLSQSPYIFDASISENIILGDETNDFMSNSRFLDVCKVAGISADHVLKKLVEDNTALGERGRLISGGQRQRIALARALYHRSNLIFLDEPTASIDSEGGALLISDLLCLRDEITIVMITHDKNNLQYFDRCYELTEDGLIKI